MENMNPITTDATPISRHTAWRMTPADEATITALEDALHQQGIIRFPTRAAVLRYALAAAAGTLKETGRLPSLPLKAGEVT